MSGCALANAFNNYFVSQSSDIATPPDGLDASSYMKHNFENSFFMSPTDEDEVFAVFRNLENSRSQDVDDLNIKVIKHTLDIVVPVLMFH